MGAWVDFDNGRFGLGDCFDLMRGVPDGSVDMVLCDLPYGTTQNAWDSVLPLDALWREYWRVCKPNAAVVLTAQTPFDKVLGVSQIAFLKYEWVWEKTEATGFLNAKVAPMKAHENVLVFYMSPPVYNPQKTFGHERKTSARTGSSPNYGAQSHRRYDSTERYPRDVLLLATDKQRGAWHPTQKPVALFEYLIRTYTNAGDVVLDNTAGSGTTAVAAENTGRRWLCIERGPGYYWKAVERVAATVIERAA